MNALPSTVHSSPLQMASLREQSTSTIQAETHLGRKEPISPEYLSKVLSLDPATGKLTWLPRPIDMFPSKRACSIWNALYAGKDAFTAVDCHGYRTGTLCDRRVKVHRVVWAISHGYWPEIVDHIDGDRQNNALQNLRDVTSAENSKNRKLPSNNKSGVMGVRWDHRRKKWSAQIGQSRKTVFIGFYEDIGDAIAARETEISRLGFSDRHGEK